MEKICFITTGYMPIPAVNGGAVETLVEDLIVQNEVYNVDAYDNQVLCRKSLADHGADQSIQKRCGGAGDADNQIPLYAFFQTFYHPMTHKEKGDSFGDVEISN